MFDNDSHLYYFSTVVHVLDEPPSMYVCLCKGITDSQIRKAVAGGMTNYRELRQSLGLSSQCGRCAVEARQIFRDACPVSHNSDLFYSAIPAVA